MHCIIAEYDVIVSNNIKMVLTNKVAISNFYTLNSIMLHIGEDLFDMVLTTTGMKSS